MMLMNCLICDVVPLDFSYLMVVILQGWVFLFSLLGIAPLAERLGYLTE